jgi:tripartite-type tricarboxylate transporter receptor subunit TctC
MTQVVKLLLSIGVWLWMTQSWAQSYPTKPVKIVVPYPPGGVGDTTTRAILVALSQSMGQSFIVDNKPGASQMLGAELVAKAAPDGYTLFLGSVTSLAINVSSQKKLPYDPSKDFAPVTMLYFSPMYLVVNPAVPARSTKELIALAKAQPGTLTFASIGQGSSIHLAGEMFKTMAGLDIVHVPYKGSAPALTDIISGQVSMMFDAGVSALPQVSCAPWPSPAPTARIRHRICPRWLSLRDCPTTRRHFGLDWWLQLRRRVMWSIACRWS